MLRDIPLAPSFPKARQDFAKRALRDEQILRERSVGPLFEAFADVSGDRIARIAGLFRQFAIPTIARPIQQRIN